MRELAADLARLEQGGPVGRAVVTSVQGSAPRQPGAVLLVRRDGALAGSVSGGCVETAAADAVLTAMREGQSRLCRFGVSDETAWSVGLACGGTIEVLAQPALDPALVQALGGSEGVVLATRLDGPHQGRPVLRISDTAPEPDLLVPEGSIPAEQISAAARDALQRGTSTAVEIQPGDGRVFLEVFPRQPRLILVGAVHIAAHLATMARHLGYRVIVTDSRETFLTRERFPDADALVPGWPDQTLPAIGVDGATCIAVLSHDPKLDEPALAVALRSPARYVGAIGSRRTQEGRRRRLREQGLTEAQLDRLHGPIGLDLGGRTPAEIALAILAEITQTRYQVPPA